MVLRYLELYNIENHSPVLRLLVKLDCIYYSVASHRYNVVSRRNKLLG